MAAIASFTTVSLSAKQAPPAQAPRAQAARAVAHSASCKCTACATTFLGASTRKTAARTFSLKASSKDAATKTTTTMGAVGYGTVTPAAYPKFFDELDKNFPGAMPYEEYLVASKYLLSSKGFTGNNSLALISMCRDEITRPFVDAADQLWGNSFSIASLAGMVMCGKTGFAAGLSHAPTEDLGADGLEKYVFIVGPHIAIDSKGEIGKVARVARPGLSGACGAVMAFQAELTGGTLSTAGDEVDLELNLMKQRILTQLKFGSTVPSLVDLTKAAHDRILIDTKSTASYAVDTKKSAAAYLSGVLVHGPDYSHYFWPASFELVTPSAKTDMLPQLLKAERSQYKSAMASYMTARNAIQSVKELLQTTGN